MGDISMRGKGRALKMKPGASTTERRKKAKEDKPSRGVIIMTNPPKFKPIPRPPESTGPKNKGPGPTIKPMPDIKPKLKGKPEAKPIPKFGIGPVPIPRPDRPNMKPMPDRRPRPKIDLEKYFMKTPLKKNDGGEMMDLKSLLSKAAFGGVGVSLEKLKKALDKGPIKGKPLPMTPELIKKFKNKMVPNPRAQQSERDRSKPIIGKPMRRSSARRK